MIRVGEVGDPVVYCVIFSVCWRVFFFFFFFYLVIMCTFMYVFCSSILIFYLPLWSSVIFSLFIIYFPHNIAFIAPTLILQKRSYHSQYFFFFYLFIYFFFFLDLEELVAIEKFDIIAITESWLNSKDRDFLAEYNLPGYSIFSYDRKTNREWRYPVY